MEIHKLKPVHSWREFLKELGTIVLGILIALGLEQAVEARHEHQLAAEAHEAILAEMQVDLDRVDYRMRQQACDLRRIEDLKALVAGWHGDRDVPEGLDVGFPGDVGLVTQRWQANLASGRFSREPAEEQSRQSAFYTTIAIVEAMTREESLSWHKLRALEMGPDVLGVGSRSEIVAALNDARIWAGEIYALSQEAVAKAAQEGMHPHHTFVPAMLGTTCRPLRTQS